MNMIPSLVWTVPPLKKYLKASFQKIKARLLFATKYDGQHKALLMADGSIAFVPADNIYVSVFSLYDL